MSAHIKKALERRTYTFLNGFQYTVEDVEKMDTDRMGNQLLLTEDQTVHVVKDSWVAMSFQRTGEKMIPLLPEKADD